MSEYARNHPARIQDAGAEYPDLVYSNWLDTFFPCRIIASGGGMTFIEALYHGEAVQMRVPAGIVYRRPAAMADLTGQALSSMSQADHKPTTSQLV